MNATQITAERTASELRIQAKDAAMDASYFENYGTPGQASAANAKAASLRLQAYRVERAAGVR